MKQFVGIVALCAVTRPIVAHDIRIMMLVLVIGYDVTKSFYRNYFHREKLTIPSYLVVALCLQDRNYLGTSRRLPTTARGRKRSIWDTPHPGREALSLAPPKKPTLESTPHPGRGTNVPRPPLAVVTQDLAKKCLVFAMMLSCVAFPRTRATSQIKDLTIEN